MFPIQIPSPMAGVKGAPKRKKDKEVQAQRTAGDIAEADKAEVDPLHRCLSSIIHMMMILSLVTPPP